MWPWSKISTLLRQPNFFIKFVSDAQTVWHLLSAEKLWSNWQNSLLKAAEFQIHTLCVGIDKTELVIVGFLRPSPFN